MMLFIFAEHRQNEEVISSMLELILANDYFVFGLNISYKRFLNCLMYNLYAIYRSVAKEHIQYLCLKVLFVYLFYLFDFV